MIMPIASNGQTDMLLPNPWDPEARKKGCKEAFNVTSEFDFVLDYFGGLNVTQDWKKVHNIIFSNGELDPWSVGGVLKNISDPEVTNTIAI